MGSHLLKKIFDFRETVAYMDTKLEPKLAMWVEGATYFHPWVDKVAQVVPNGAQSGSKGAQRLLK